MRIGVNLYSKWPFREVIDAFLKNGIDRTFVCIEHPHFDEVMCALEKANITVDNLHAPFKRQNLIWADGDGGEEMLESFLKSVDSCVKYGVGLLVAHASNGRPMPEISDVGLARFDKFIAYAKSNGITVAFENHRYVENVRCIIERYPDVRFCLDTSHENAFTPGVRYMPMWGGRLAATHISDNECVCDKDMHMLPFDGCIDFSQTAREIAESGRDVTLMLEVKPDNHSRYIDVSVNDYYAAAAERIGKFARMVEKCRSVYGGKK